MSVTVEFNKNDLMTATSGRDEARRKTAALLDVSTKTIFRWERAGRLTGIELNSRTTRYSHEVKTLIADSVVDCGGAR